LLFLPARGQGKEVRAMQVNSFASEKREAIYNQGDTSHFGRKFAWIKVSSNGMNHIDLDLDEGSLIFLDRLRFAVDEAIKFLRSN
jgi:hypothetical protein